MSDFSQITRRDAVKTMGGLAMSAMLPDFVSTADFKTRKPNIIFIECDQFRADVCRREGIPLDTPRSLIGWRAPAHGSTGLMPHYESPERFTQRPFRALNP